MKLKTVLAVAATLSLVFNPAGHADEDTPLNKEMTAMNKSLRTLKRQIADPAKKADSLALLEKIKANIAAAMKLQPSKIKDVPEAEKAAYVEKYKQQLVELDKTFDGIAASLKADKAEEAKAAFEKLSEQKEKGHKDFGVDEE